MFAARSVAERRFNVVIGVRKNGLASAVSRCSHMAGVDTISVVAALSSVLYTTANQVDVTNAPPTMLQAPLQTSLQASRLSHHLRSVMRKVPSPVVVVTTKSINNKCEKIHRGVTCSSFTSVSLDPPIISFCISTPSRTAEVLKASKMCIVNVLAASQASFSKHFSKGIPPDADSVSEDQFLDIPHTIDPETGIPVLPDTLGAIVCERHGAYEIGDKLVWFGDVTNAMEGTGGSALLYYKRSYHNIGEEAFMHEFEDTSLSFEKWTHSAHVRMAWNYTVEHGGYKRAIPFIRDGIRSYNAANADKVTHGFNETITSFYAWMIDHCIHTDLIDGIDPDAVSFSEFLQRHPNLLRPNLPLDFYSKNILSSPDARERFIKPDVVDLPALHDDV
eukprot:CFRG1925T1